MPRVRRVIADDILTDFLTVLLRQAQPIERLVLKTLVSCGARDAVNWLVRRARSYETRTISAGVQQDVLLLAGAKDHYVPLQQFYEQIGTLTRCRSLTARLFTSEEQGQNHCQIGNLGLSLRVMLLWLEALAPREAGGVVSP